MLKGNVNKIYRAFPGFNCFIKPAVKNNHDKGRPRNGMFIVFTEEIKNDVEDISPAFWRIQAAKIKSGNNATVIINSYFPQDPRTQTFDESELIETLECIKNVMEDNPFSHFLWAGDIIMDFQGIMDNHSE